MSKTVRNRFLGLFLFLSLLAVSFGTASEEASNFNEVFRERLVQWFSLLEKTLTQLDAEIEKAEEIKREAEAYLKKREVRSNYQLSRTFFEAKTAAERAIRTHTRTRRFIRTRVGHIREIQSLLTIETISLEQGVTLEILGPARVERQGREVFGTGGSSTPFIVKPGDFLEVGESGRLTFLLPKIGAELSVEQNTTAIYEKVVAGRSPRLKLLEGKIKFQASKIYGSFMGHVVLPVSEILKPRRFAITTPGPAVGVRATAFSFEYERSGRATLTIWEGSVDITPWENADELNLTAPVRLVIGPGEMLEGPVTLTPEEIERISAGAPDS